MIDILKRKYLIIISLLLIIVGVILIYLFIIQDKEVYKIEESNDILEISDYSSEVLNITVEIKGEVLTPGVYTLSNNSIINDLINLSGGLTENAYTDNINLSMKLSDEMVVIIYNKNNFKEVKNIYDNTLNSTCSVSSSDISNCIKDNRSVIKKSEDESKESEENNTSNSSKLININTASLSELMSLNGIGEKKAESIIKYRENKLFETIEEITKVSGIGNSIYEKIKEYITI